MPVPLSRTRKRASNVNRSCGQIKNGTVGLPGGCRFYNVGGIYNIGARSKFVRQSIKKRTQLCCNCEGEHLSGDIARRRTSKGPCNSRSNNLDKIIGDNEETEQEEKQEEKQEEEEDDDE